MNKKIVVLGGSFNPPTIAHEIILRTAVKETWADIGLFVPSSDNYVKHKMSRTGGQVFDEQIRLKMLKAVCETNPKFDVSNVEYGDDGRGHTYQTLCKIQAQNPGAEIRLIVGDDKLKIIPRWHDAEKLLAEFGLVIIRRSTTNEDHQKICEQLVHDRFFGKYASHLNLIDLHTDVSGISSTKARADIANGRLMQSTMLADFTKQIIAHL